MHTRGSAVLERLKVKSGNAKPHPHTGARLIDPATMPLVDELTRKSHRIGVADDINFEYGLNCILDHASRLIEQNANAPGGTANWKRQASS
jgi:hypothetical protein